MKFPRSVKDRIKTGDSRNGSLGGGFVERYTLPETNKHVEHFMKKVQND